MGPTHGRNIKPSEEERVLNLKHLNARVDRISIDGVARTKDDFVLKAVDDLFKVNNFEEMLKTAHDVKTRLDGLGCFQQVSIHIDTSTGPKATPEVGYEVTFTVRELKRVGGGVHTTVGTNNESHFVASLRLPNILGRAEKIHGELSYGTKKTKNFIIQLTKPLLIKHNASVSSNIFAHEEDWPMSKYGLRETGVIFDLSFFSLSHLKHSVQWAATMRDIVVGNRYAPFEVREQAGSTLKSSVKNILTYDTRKSLIFPSAGILAKLTSEFSGLGGNVGFIKNDALLQLDIPLLNDIVLQGSFGGGAMVPIASPDKSIKICDHFFLGGPVTFRGFEMRGAGPSKDGSFVGAKVYWCAGLSLFTPLPFRPSAGGFGEYFRTHFFVNCGSIGDFNTADGVKPFLEHVRLAYGIGLALRLGEYARVEVNYCLPAWICENDRAVHGVQIGLGTSL